MDDTDVPALVGVCSVEDNEDSDGWDEMEVTGEQTTCLFCSLQFHTIAVALDHCRTEHNFDLLELKTKYKMDCYSFIKMVNYIRKHKPEPKVIVDSPTALWESDEYLKPGEMESWLIYDFDDLGSAPSTPHYAIDGKAPINNITYADLQRQIQDLTVELRHKDALLHNAMQDIAKMKTITRNIVDAGDISEARPTCVASVPLGFDSEYFNSYAHYGIHHEMLNGMYPSFPRLTETKMARYLPSLSSNIMGVNKPDKVRTESYRDAILHNVDSFRGKTVLDLGCGTGILSMFAAKAEAKKVYGIDQSEVIYKAMEIVRENNMSEVIQLIHGRLEDTELPEKKVDIILSEWMGYFLLFEGMLDSFIHARDNHLKDGGIVLPSRCNISIVGCSDLERYNTYIDFWDDVYGFNMKCMKTEVLSEANVETIPKDTVITEPVVIADLNLYTCTTNTTYFTSNFDLKVTRGGKLTALVGYFDTFFELDKPVSFSTGPQVTRTHWQQTIFFLKNVIEVKDGDVISGSLTCCRRSKNVRGLAVKIVIGNDTYEYRLE